LHHFASRIAYRSRAIRPPAGIRTFGAGGSVRASDFWTFVAIDPVSKDVPSYLVGTRTAVNASAFMQDLSERLTNRLQILSDGLRSYVDAVEQAFGADVDYDQIVKFYDAEPIGPGRYSPPRVTGVERTVVAGSPPVRTEPGPRQGSAAVFRARPSQSGTNKLRISHKPLIIHDGVCYTTGDKSTSQGSS
jgi:hypothetical protein